MNIEEILLTELEQLKKQNKHHRTGEVRKISRTIYEEIKELPIDKYLDKCENLLQLRTWSSWIVAFDLAFRKRKSYSQGTFDIFEHWLFEYVRDWEDCDDFCVHPLGALLLDHNELIERIYSWCDSPHFWVRRAAAVSLIYSIRRDEIDNKHVLLIAEKLVGDDHYLVQKGYGWMLREYSNKHEDEVIQFVKKHGCKMSRMAFRYALRDVDETIRKEFMEL